MIFEAKINELIFDSEIFSERKYMFDADLRMGRGIIWNRDECAKFMIDNEPISINKNCVILLTEYHNIDKLNLIA